MALRGTYSPRTALADILDALGPLSGVATESTLGNLEDKLGDQALDIKKIRRGNELFLYDNEVDDGALDDK